jgi:hypothetical protein
MRFKPSIIIILLLISTTTVFSQKNTFSPYSRYGLGELAHQGFTSNLALGATNTALRIPNQINYLNPASYTIQDTNSFIFDVGLKGSLSQFQTNGAEMNKKNAGFDYLAIGFPVTRWWKASIGIVPYSNVGYNILTSSTQEDGIRNNQYEGRGGLRKFYVGNSFEPIENLSVGFNYLYMFGTLSYKSVLGWEVDSTQVAHYSILKQRDKIIRGSQFDLGIQYTYDFSENTNLTIGVSYETTVNFDYEENAYSTNTLDTVSNSFTENYDFPDNLSAGLALETNKLLWGVDVNYTNWSSLNKIDNLKDSYSIHTGLQFTPDRNALRNYFKRINYRVGAYYKNGYFSFENNEINDFGITFGLGLPIKYQKTKFNLAVMLGQKGTTDHDLIENNYAIINFGITFYDFWFIERKYQ